MRAPSACSRRRRALYRPPYAHRVPRLQGGADTITLQNGNVSVAYADQAGFVFSNLAFGQLIYSPAIVNAACIFYSVGSNYSTVDAYLISEDNLDAMLNAQVGQGAAPRLAQDVTAPRRPVRAAQSVFDLSKAVPASGSASSGQQSASNLVPVGNDTYRLVIVNSGGQGATVGSTGAATTVGYRLAGYSAASGGARAGWPPCLPVKGRAHHLLGLWPPPHAAGSRPWERTGVARAPRWLHRIRVRLLAVCLQPTTSWPSPAPKHALQTAEGAV